MEGQTGDGPVEGGGNSLTPFVLHSEGKLTEEKRNGKEKRGEREKRGKQEEARHWKARVRSATSAAH